MTPGNVPVDYETLYERERKLSDERLIIVTALEEQLKNSKYYRYCNIARNEIAKFDKYAWSAMPKFQYVQADLNYFAERHTYEELQEEKRKLRWIHILQHSTEDAVIELRNKISSSFTFERFAELVVRGYRLISEDIHAMSYNISFSAQYCPKLTSDKVVNTCLNVIMDRIELDVGEMVPRKKQKLDTSS